MTFNSVSDVLEVLAPAVPVETEAWEDVLVRAQLLDVAANGDSLAAARPLRKRFGARVARRPRLVLLVGLLVLAFVLIVAAAYALGHPLINFSSAPPAAPSVVKDFSSLSVGAPAGMDPRAIADQTRLVGKVDGDALSVAPTRAGGLCFAWSHIGGGGCDALGTIPFSVDWIARPRRAPKIANGGFMPPSTPPSFRAVDGFVRFRWVAAVAIKLDDGSTIHPQLLWISPPIEAGFFHYHAPPGRAIVAVLALKNGEAVDGEQTSQIGVLPEPHPYADLSKRQRLAVVETPAGEASIWSAPTKAGLTCHWLEFRDEDVVGLGCSPKGYEHQTNLAYNDYALGGQLVLADDCGYSAVEFFHRDGSVRKIPCADGVALASLDSADASGDLGTLDASGHLLKGSRIPVPRPILRR